MPPKKNRKNHEEEEEEEEEEVQEEHISKKGDRGNKRKEEELEVGDKKNKNNNKKKVVDEEDVPSSKSKNRKKRGDDSDDSEQEQPKKSTSSQEAVGLSRSAQLKAKREARKNKGNPPPPSKINDKKNNNRQQEEEEEEDFQQEEEEEEEEEGVFHSSKKKPTAKEEEEDDDDEEEEEEEEDLAKELEHLALEEAMEEIGEDESNLRRADKKKQKKAEEKKKRTKEKHGFIDIEPIPTPPPQQLITSKKNVFNLSDSDSDHHERQEEHHVVKSKEKDSKGSKLQEEDKSKKSKKKDGETNIHKEEEDGEKKEKKSKKKDKKKETDDSVEEEDDNKKEKKKKKKEEEEDGGDDDEKDKKKKKKDKGNREKDENEEEDEEDSKKKKKKKKETEEQVDDELAQELSKSKKKKKKEQDEEEEGALEDKEDDISSKQDEDMEEEEEEEEEDTTTTATTTSTKTKKLSNKERRELRKKEEAEKEVFYEGGHGGSGKLPDNKVFAVSATSVNVNDENWKLSRNISIPNFSISTKGKTLYNNAELKIAEGRRYGLVGANGLGKSVVLRAIASRELPIPPVIDCLYVEQEVLADDTPAVDVVLSADERRSYLLKREAELLEILENEEAENNSDELHKEFIAVCDELRLTKADAAEAKALNLLRGLGFSDEMSRKPTKELSGGWRMRVSIAKGLFIEPTLLLLDEPTNHLDLEAVIFLESVLSKWEKTLVVVSHDQDFLDTVCQEIIHLENQKLHYFNGNYSRFEEMYEVEHEKQKKDYEQQQKQLQKDKQRNNKLTNKQQQLRDQRQLEISREKRGKKGGADEEIALHAAGKNRGQASGPILDRPKDYVVKFTFPTPSELTPPIIQVRDVDFQYTPTSPVLFRNLNFGIDMQSRICICGPNGAGKSTLIGLITQSLTPTNGEVLINRHLRVAAYKQHFIDALPLKLTPIEYLHKKHNIQEQEIRGTLGKYGLSGVAHTIPMSSLSGGQKARVVFADMSYQNPHIIIADEPSNNLDMQSIRALGEAIREFEGGVVLVSHDTRLITETGMILWVVENQKVYEQTGGIDEYREEILDKLERREREAARVLEEKQAKRALEREQKLKEMEERMKRRSLANAAAAAVSSKS